MHLLCEHGDVAAQLDEERVHAGERAEREGLGSVGRVGRVGQHGGLHCVIARRVCVQWQCYDLSSDKSYLLYFVVWLCFVAAVDILSFVLLLFVDELQHADLLS